MIAYHDSLKYVDYTFLPFAMMTSLIYLNVHAIYFATETPEILGAKEALLEPSSITHFDGIK